MEAELRLHATSHLVKVANLSRYGAFVTELPRIPRNARVTLTIPSDERPIRVTGQIVHWVDEAAASRLGTCSGAGVRFFVAAVDAYARLDALAAELVAAGGDGMCEPINDEPQTRRLVRPVVASMVSAMTEVDDRRIGLECVIGEIDLSMLLAMLAHTRRSGRLLVERAHVVATVQLDDGDIVDAHCSTATACPYAIARMMLHWCDGVARFCAQPRPDMRPMLRITVSQLLFDHAQECDASDEIAGRRGAAR